MKVDEFRKSSWSYEDKKNALLFMIGILMIVISFWPDGKPQKIKAPEIRIEVIRADDQSAELCVDGKRFIILKVDQGAITGYMRDPDLNISACEMRP